MTESMLNWDFIQTKSEEFKTNKPFPYGFVKSPIKQQLYEELLSTFPTVDEKWYSADDYTRSSVKRQFGKCDVVIKRGKVELTTSLMMMMIH